VHQSSVDIASVSAHPVASVNRIAAAWSSIYNLARLAWAGAQRLWSMSAGRCAVAPRELRYCELRDADIQEIAGKLFTSLQRAPAGDVQSEQQLLDLLNAATSEVVYRSHNPDMPPARLQSLVDELPRQTRLVLEMHVEWKLNYRRISEELEIPPQEVLSMLKTAYVHLSKGTSVLSVDQSTERHSSRATGRADPSR
jgi:DNA-directed RNA polymerase specialized sigma24 family protein